MPAILTPGAPLDAQVAQAVWKAMVLVDGATGERTLVAANAKDPVPLPRFSADLGDAYKVVAAMKAKGWIFAMRHEAVGGGRYCVAFGRDDGLTYRYTETAKLALSICLAALAALGGMNVPS